MSLVIKNLLTNVNNDIVLKYFELLLSYQADYADSALPHW